MRRTSRTSTLASKRERIGAANAPGLYSEGGWQTAAARHGRVLNDGTTQLTQCSYNSVGNLTEITYPTGQTFNFIYAANGIDLVLVQQVTDNGPVTIAPRQSGIVVRLAQAACMVGSRQPLFAGTPGSPNCRGEAFGAGPAIRRPRCRGYRPQLSHRARFAERDCHLLRA